MSRKTYKRTLTLKSTVNSFSFFHFNAQCFFQSFKYFTGINVIAKPLTISDVKKGHEDLAGQINGIFVIHFLRIFLTITTISIYNSKYYFWWSCINIINIYCKNFFLQMSKMICSRISLTKFKVGLNYSSFFLWTLLSWSTFMWQLLILLDVKKEGEENVDDKMKGEF